jgi:hypothetical protein
MAEARHLLRINSHRTLREGEDVERFFDLAATDQRSNKVELLRGTTNGGANSQSFLFANAAGGGLLTH